VNDSNLLFAVQRIMPSLKQITLTIEPAAYRLAVFLMMAMMDDAAMLAMWFF